MKKEPSVKARRCIAFWFAMFAWSMISPQIYADPLDTLHLRNPLPTPDDLRTIVFGNGKFIAGDGRGDVFASEDGLQWTAIGKVPGDYLIRIAYGSGRYVAFSAASNILSSDDGSIWTVRYSAPQRLGDGFTYLAYGNGRFVVTASLAAMTLTSTDGIAWEQHTACGCNLSVIAFGNGMFAAHSSTGVSTSTDGVEWTPHSLPAGYSRGQNIAYGDGKFVVRGFSPGSGSQQIPGIWHSLDGTNWMRVSTNGLSSNSPWFDFLGGIFLAHGDTVVTSPDGLTWTTNSLPGGLYLHQIAYGNGVFVSVSASGPHAVGRSTNGTQWTVVTVPAADRSFDSKVAAYGAGRYILIGSRGAVTSTEGTNFLRNGNLPPTTSGGLIRAGGQFVTVGPGGAIFRSPEGTNWSMSRSGTLQHLHDIAYGASTYVAVGDEGTIRTSQDGVLWSGASSDTDYSLYGVAFANNQFVAVGQLGIVLTSADGLTWVPQYNADFSTLNKIIHAEDRFIAVGYDAILTSGDGTTWTRIPTGFHATLNDIAHGGGLYVAVSSISGRYENFKLVEDGRVFASADGITWTERSHPLFGKLAGAAFLNSTFVLFGVEGTVLQSDPAGALPVMLTLTQSDPMLQLRVHSEQIGATYHIDSCTNLVHDTWSEVTTFTQTQPITTVELPGGLTASQCYYRIRSP
jgi:hypothetical protein